jgi:hypothetical protein
VTALLSETARSAQPEPVGFEVGFIAEDGVAHRVSLPEAGEVRFELGIPVRRFFSRKGQRHLSGLWWSATTGGHVGFESWLERDQLMLLDFDPCVVGIASQPFWLRWMNESGERLAHVPDYFVRRADGSVVVVDCRPLECRKRPDVAKTEPGPRPRLGTQTRRHHRHHLRQPNHNRSSRDSHHKAPTLRTG